MDGNGHANSGAVDGEGAAEEIYDLLVIGGGPIGLASAIAAARSVAAKKVILVDQTSSFRKSGDFMNVNPNGIRALRCFSSDVADAIVASHRAANRFVMREASGGLYDIPNCDDVDGIPNVGTRWYFVQKLLLDAVENLPDKIRVETNAQFVEFESTEEVVTAKFVVDRVRKNPFAHWGNDPTATTYEAPEGSDTPGTVVEPSPAGETAAPKEIRIKAQCVFACDGINSKARQEVYRLHGKDVESAKAHYSGFISLKGTVRTDVAMTAELEKEVEELYVPEGQGISMAGGPSEDPDMPTMIVLRLKGDFAQRLGMSWRFICHAVVDEAVANTKDKNQVLPAVLEQLENGGFPDCLLQFFEEVITSEESKVLVRPLYLVPVCYPPNYPVTTKSTVPSDGAQNEGTCPFGYGRIFLVGDSLHGMPPFLSLGTSAGFEDVAELVPLLFNGPGGDDDIDYEKAQKKYVEARLERIENTQRETLARRWAHDQEKYARNFRNIRHFVPENTMQ